MARTVEITPTEVVVRLSGWTALAAIRRELRIPRSAIQAVSTDRWARDGFRVGGTAFPWSEYRQGRFRRRGRKQFLSFERRDRVVALEVDRGAVGYDVVAVGVDDPERLAAELGA
jgi:hypothetical protein